MLFTLDASPIFNSFDFTMCNPPFYASQAELEKLASEKEFSPHAVRKLFFPACILALNHVAHPSQAG